MAVRTDALLLEENLVRLGDLDIDLRIPLFEKFLAAHPVWSAAFLNMDASSRRMTDATLQMLYGLACAEEWVPIMVAELVANHRNYGDMPFVLYDDFIDKIIAEIKFVVGPDWSEDHDQAWDR